MDFQRFDPHRFVERLRQKQAVAQLADGTIDEAAAPPVEVTQESLARERRASRLRAAGAMNPKAVEVAAQSIGRCPRVDGNPASERIASEVEAFVRSDLQTLVLVAAPGRGKSWAATWAVAESILRGLWLQSLEVRVGPAWDALRERALKAPLLVLDDLGEEGGADWGVKEVAALLQSRHNTGSKTLVTTNLIEPEIEARYGERLVSRWSEAGVSKIVAVQGTDLRRSASRR